MSLLDLKTDLKSLKYGKDRPGGGDSGQPYQKVDINTVDSGFNRFRMTKFDDGLVRGGVVGAANAAIVDTLRIGKFLKDFPKGPLFIVKQIGLQLSNPALETKKITIGNGRGVLGFIGNALSAVNNALGPTRIYNLGINTLAQVPVNAFGIHFNRHGLVPVQDDSTKYLAVAQSNNKGSGAGNRLVGLTNRFGLGNTPPSGPTSFLRLSRSEKKLLRLGKKLFNDIQSSKIDDYIGGPGSTYGIGRTLIKRYAPYTVDATQGEKDKSNPNQVKVDFSNVSDLGIGGKAISSYGNIRTDESSIKEGINITSVQYTNPSLKKYSELKKQVDKQASGSVFNYNPFKNTNLGSSGLRDLYNGVINGYTDANIKYNNGIDKPITIKGTWKTLNREVRIGSGRQDQINLTPIFSNTAGTIGDTVFIPGLGEKNIKDLVKFRIQALNGDDPTQADWMIFRAYLTQFSDNTDAKWNTVNYAGRGEDFFIYGGFSRKIQIGFKVAALSAEEMKPMYQKLNYLMGNLMPDYKDNIMRGPLVKMTVGNWLDGQDGILNSVSYTVPNDSPWEIALNEPLPGGSRELILPHVIEVSMTFTPIGSQTKGDNLVSKKSFITSHIAQNINDYQYITGSIQPNNQKLVNKVSENLKPNPQSIRSVSSFEEGNGPQ
jgi:hypothetical protein